MHESVAMIDSIQFVDLQQLDINPLMSSCQIKVLYIGQNRNGSLISKETAVEMSKTLRGSPIVGWFKETKEDFADHGEVVTVDDEGFHFNCMTKPYGFVSPDAKVWFQFFEEKDELGNTVLREYLVTNGFLWTGQFPECQCVIDEGRPQSMELDEKSLDGYWAKVPNQMAEFFIINDAIFSKLCILGSDVEPCFEGSSITQNTQFSKDNDIEFKNTLFSMMQDLKFALEGGKSMENLENIEGKPTETVPTENQENMEPSVNSETSETSNSSIVAPSVSPEADPASSDFSANKEEDNKEDKEEDNKEEDDKKKDEEDDYACKKKKYELLEQDFNELKDKYSELEQKFAALEEFKLNADNKAKDELIASFANVVNSQDIEEISANKAKFSLEEIEAKLSICESRQRRATVTNTEPTAEKPALTFNLNENTGSCSWFEAAKAYEQSI